MYQVCEAGLHISLGVGLRQFKLLEHQLQLLDLEIAICRAEAVMSSSEEELHHLLKDAQALESESEDLVQEADHHQEVHDWYRASGDPDDEAVPLDVQLGQLRQTIQGLYKTAKAKVSTTICHLYS